MKVHSAHLRNALAALACLCGPALAASVSQFQDFSLQENGVTTLPGRLYAPSALDNPANPRPLVVFLHGAGESGTNNTSQINSLIDPLLAECGFRRAFLYAPQANGSWRPQSVTDRIITMIDRLAASTGVNNRKIYVTGLSMGGGGTWTMLSRYGDRFAAGVPIAGESPAPDFDPAKLTGEAVWAFHGRNDQTIPVEVSRQIVDGVLASAGRPTLAYPASASPAQFDFTSAAPDLRYREYANAGHGVWPTTYGSQDMYTWLFAHTSAVPEPAGVAGLAGAGGLLLRRRRTR